MELKLLGVLDTYDKLSKGLQDIIDEAKEIKSITIGEVTYNIEFFLGRDWKFLAATCGLETATAEHACIWCKCSKLQRSDMKLTWSITDATKGARTIEEITKKSKLGKRTRNISVTMLCHCSNLFL